MRHLACATIGLILLCSGSTFAADTAAVEVDFSTPAGPPLSKSKFGVFNSGMVRPDRYRRDLPLFDEVRPDSLRIDLGWGAGWIGRKSPVISGTADDPRFDFSDMDATADALRKANVPAYWSYCYTPTSLQSKRGDYTSPPADLAAYGRMIRTVVAHYRDYPGGDPVGYHEIGNEPDNPDFFTGGRDRYLDLYETGSQAVTDANPSAVVGGPALAFSSGWVDPFLDRVVDRKLRLDFYSFHYYPGVPYQSHDLPGVLRQMRDALDRQPSLRTTEAHLNEFNAYKIDYPRGGSQDRAPMAADFLHAVSTLLDQTWLTKVHWAQFQDSGGGNYSGMIDFDGHRKGIFNAYALYARMPVDRRRLTTTGAVEGFASVDGDRSAILLWNPSKDAIPVSLHLIGSHAKRGTLTRIDAAHASHGDHVGETLAPIPVEIDPDWTGDLPPGGVACFEFGDPPPAPHPVGRFVREWHDYPDRHSTAYAEYDRRTGAFRLSNPAPGPAMRIGATLDELPPVVIADIDAGNSLIRVQFDYPGSRTNLELRNSTGHYNVDLAKAAPPGWSGRAVVTVSCNSPTPAGGVVVRLRTR